MLASNRQKFLLTEPAVTPGCRTERRARGTAALPASTNAVAGPSLSAGPVAMSSVVIDVAAVAGSTSDTAVNVGGSIDGDALDGRELAGPGAATRALAAMSAANATMSLVRTVACPSLSRGVKCGQASRTGSAPGGYGSRHWIRPVWQALSAAHVADVRSHVRPETYGPRSTTRTVMVRPLAGLRNVTRVPHGSDLCATPTSERVSVWPHAVPLPYRPGPYQLYSALRHDPELELDVTLDLDVFAMAAGRIAALRTTVTGAAGTAGTWSRVGTAATPGSTSTVITAAGSI